MTKSARDDLYGIGRYIALELLNPLVADRTVEAIQLSVLGLSDMPYRFPLVDDERLAAMGYRKLPIKNYLAFFTIDEETNIVNVERILYARRDWLHML